MDLTSPDDTAPAPGGALTEMLRALRLEGVDYGRCELGAPRAVLFPVQKAARFHFIGRAGCWLLSPLGEWMELKAGDALLLPRGAEHILASAPGVQAEPLESYSVEPLQDNVYAVSNGGHGAKTLLFCGSMHFNHDGSHPLLAMMPDMLRTKELMAGEPGIPHLLEAMADEATSNRAGSGIMLARLADVLAAAIIRSWVENSAGDITGWIAAIKIEMSAACWSPFIGSPRGTGPSKRWPARWAPHGPPLPNVSRPSSERRRQNMSPAYACIRQGGGSWKMG